MGRSTLGIEGLVTSWGVSGDDCFHLVATGARITQATLNQNSDSLDNTGFAASLTAQGARAGLRSWTVAMSGICPKASPDIGRASSVTFATGYAAKVRGFTLNIAAQVHDSTEATGTAIDWRLFQPGMNNATGTFTCQVDADVPTVLTTAPTATSASLVLQTTASNTITVNVVITGLVAQAVVNGENTLTYSFRADGPVTVAGTAGILPAGALGIFDWDDADDGVADRLLTFQSDAGHVYRGAAFIASLALTCNFDALITVSITAQGSGALELNPA